MTHLKTTWWDVADGCLDIVGDPFHKVGGVLVLDVQHLLIHLLHGHATSEDGGHGEVAAVTWVTSSHHVLGVEHLLGQLGDGQGPVLLAASGCEGSEPWHEEVETGEGHHVDCQLSQVSVQLAGESEAGGHARHGGADEVVEVTVGGGGQLEGTEADVIQGFIVNAVCLICVLYKLVD